MGQLHSTSRDHSDVAHRTPVCITQEEVQQLPLVPHIVYARLSEHVYYCAASNSTSESKTAPYADSPNVAIPALPDGWTLLCTSTDYGLSREGYYAAAYINAAVRHCIIAQRGSMDIMSLRAGLWVLFEEPTIQFALAEQFSRLVRLRLSLTSSPASPAAAPALPSAKADDSDYFISYTGHSLGAVLAACRATAEFTFAITFESPGCRGFVERTMHPFKAEDADIITYQRSPNPINTLRPQMGYLIQLPFLGSPLAQPRELEQRWRPDGKAIEANTDPRNISCTFTPNTNQNGSSNGSDGGPTQRSTNINALSSTIKYAMSALSSRLPTGAMMNAFGGAMGNSMLPDLIALFRKYEPVLRQLMQHTEQSHSIHDIVQHFADNSKNCNIIDNVYVNEAKHQQLIQVWPANLFQYVEYLNVTRAMNEDPSVEQHPHLKAAYLTLLRKLYLVSERPCRRIGLRYLSRDCRRLLLAIDYANRSGSLSNLITGLPITPVEARVMSAASIQGDTMVIEQESSITTLQMKMLLAVVVARPAVRNALYRAGAPDIPATNARL